MVTQLRQALIAQHTQPTLLRTTVAATRRVLFAVALLVYAVALLINGARFLALRDSSPSWMDMWLVR
jgi:hypothetical protein